MFNQSPTDHSIFTFNTIKILYSFITDEEYKVMSKAYYLQLGFIILFKMQRFLIEITCKVSLSEVQTNPFWILLETQCLHFPIWELLNFFTENITGGEIIAGLKNKSTKTNQNSLHFFQSLPLIHAARGINKLSSLNV